MILEPPTQGHIHQRLVQEEKAGQLAGQRPGGNAQLMNMAFKLEHEQYI